jgi:hypothetical protein
MSQIYLELKKHIQKVYFGFSLMGNFTSLCKTKLEARGSKLAATPSSLTYSHKPWYTRNCRNLFVLPIHLRR